MASKKFLIISLISSFAYIVIGLVLMFVNKLNTVSIILFALIVLVGLVSSLLTWKIMYDQNRGKSK